MGEVVVIDWRLTTYSDLTITEGTGLLFQWAGPVQHNVIEMASPLSVTQDCKFVNLDSKKLGQVYELVYTTLQYCDTLLISACNTALHSVRLHYTVQDCIMQYKTAQKRIRTGGPFLCTLGLHYTVQDCII